MQGMRTVVAGQSEPTQSQAEEGKLYNETWTWYPDDMPLRSLYGGDSRAALVSPHASLRACLALEEVIVRTPAWQEPARST